MDIRPNALARRIPRSLRAAQSPRSRARSTLALRALLDRPTPQRHPTTLKTILHVYQRRRLRRLRGHRRILIQSFRARYLSARHQHPQRTRRRVQRLPLRNQHTARNTKRRTKDSERGRIRNALYNHDKYIEWAIIESVVKQLNNHYDEHGTFPAEYTELVSTPQPNGTLPYAPDKGDYSIHEVEITDTEVVFTMNAPDSLSPDSHHDWSDHTITFPVSSRISEMLEQGDAGAPILHESEHGYTLTLPIDIDALNLETVEGRALALDLGVKKQATATVVEHKESDEDDEEEHEHEQVAPPIFLDHPRKQKLFRFKNDAEGINNKLEELREDGKDHTEEFDKLLAEYRLTRRKERRLRDQVQHDIANQLVWLALQHGCETIVFESLGQLSASDASGKTAWSISSWARSTLLDHTEYKSDLVGLDVATVNPWGTSRHCPRCGEKGKTLVAPDERTESRHGGHFYCPSCGYECDRGLIERRETALE